MATASARLITAYRETLRRCRFLGGERGRATRLDAQRSRGARAPPTTPAAEAHLAQAASRLSFPADAHAAVRRRGGVAADGDRGDGRGTLRCRDGKLVSSAALREGKARHSQWDGGNLDPDSVRKHQQLLERQHFGGPTWANSRRRSPFDR